MEGEGGKNLIFTPAEVTVTQKLKLARVLKQYAKYEALIVDDIGYVQQSREEMEVLYTLS